MDKEVIDELDTIKINTKLLADGWWGEEAHEAFRKGRPRKYMITWSEEEFNWFGEYVSFVNEHAEEPKYHQEWEAGHDDY